MVYTKNKWSQKLLLAKAFSKHKGLQFKDFSSTFQDPEFIYLCQQT